MHSLDGEALQELVHLGIRHLLSKLSQDVSHFTGANEAVTALVKHLEALDEFICSVSEWCSSPADPNSDIGSRR